MVENGGQRKPVKFTVRNRGFSLEKQGFGLDSGQLLRKLSEIDDFLRKINDLASINQWKTVKSPLKWWKMAENGQKW